MGDPLRKNIPPSAAVWEPIVDFDDINLQPFHVGKGRKYHHLEKEQVNPQPCSVC